MSQVMTQAECVDQMWSQNVSQELKAGCVLDNHLTLEQLSKKEFWLYTRQEESSCRKTLRHECEKNLLQVENPRANLAK